MMDNIGNKTQKHSNAKRSTTRYLAALDFLLNIPLSNESTIRQNGMQHAKRIQQMQSLEAGEVDSEIAEEDLLNQIQPQVMDDYLTSTSDQVGRKLPGIAAPAIRIPIQHRYYMTKITEQSAVVRHWEDQLLISGPISSSTSPQPLLSSRMFVSRARAYPMVVFSIIKYDISEEKAKLERLKSDNKKGLEAYELPKRDWRGLSYKQLFKPMIQARAEDYWFEQGYMYDPNILDDPDMNHGSHKFVLEKNATTGPIISSIILFVTDKALKDDLNEQFRETHSNLPPSLTLSKIRSLKKATLVLCHKLDFEIATIALAVISFERLCLLGKVTKANRKLSMGVCLLLSYKFNEPVTQRYRIRLDAMLDYIDEEWEVSRNEIFDAEFGAFVHLGFSLHVPHQHIYLVYTRLLKLQQKTSRQYLTDEMSDLYTHNILFLEHMKLEHARRLEEAEIEREKLAMMEIVSEENNENNDDSNIKEVESEVEIEKEPSNEKISSEKISPLRSALATFGRTRSLTSSFALIDPIGLTGGNTASDDDQYSPKKSNENLFSVSRSNKSDENLAEKPEVSATQSEKSKSILPFFSRRNSTNNTNTNSSANITNSSNTTNSSSEALDKL